MWLCRNPIFGLRETQEGRPKLLHPQKLNGWNPRIFVGFLVDVSPFPKSGVFQVPGVSFWGCT